MDSYTQGEIVNSSAILLIYLNMLKHLIKSYTTFSYILQSCFRTYEKFLDSLCYILSVLFCYTFLFSFFYIFCFYCVRVNWALGMWLGSVLLHDFLFFIDDVFYLICLGVLIIYGGFLRLKFSLWLGKSRSIEFILRLRARYFFFFSQLALRSFQLISLLTFFYLLGTYFTFYGPLFNLFPNYEFDYLSFLVTKRSPFLLFILFLCTLISCFFFQLFRSIFFIYPQPLAWTLLIEPVIIFFFLVGAVRWFLQTQNFFSMFLTIELISYATLLLMSSRFLSTYRSFYISEAAFKYFLFSSIAIGFFFLAGLGFCFFFQTTNFKELALISCFNPLLYYLYFDNIFVIYLLFFFSYIIKIGAVPVHQWLIDAYEGTEISLLGYLIAIIGPVFQFKLFSLIIILEPDENLIFWFFIIIGFFCQSVGTIGAFFQYRIKRFFLFSGLTHLGFIFISLACGSLWGTYTAFFYTIIYIVLNFFLFLVFFFTKFASFGQPGFVYFTQLKTLVASNNFIFLAFVILLLSFSGFPPFATFFSKLFVFSLLVQHELFFLIVMFIFYTVINIFLYLRLLKLASFERLTVKTYFNITSWWYKIAVTRFRSSARLGKVVSNTFFPISVLIFLVMLCGFFILFMPLFLFVTFQLFTTTFFL